VRSWHTIVCEGDKAVTLTAFGPFLSYEVIGALIEALAKISVGLQQGRRQYVTCEARWWSAWPRGG
jgi:hypothetical protein